MAWREEIKPASFRGIAFYVDTSEVKFGRRNVLHEYPYKDVPYVEDVGQKAKEINFTAYFLGDNYIQERNRLVSLISRSKSEGTLIHPTLGTITVKPTDQCSISDNGRQGGKGSINLSFVEAGENTFPSIRTNTDTAVFNQVSKLKTSIQNIFGQVFKTSGLSGFVRNSGIDVVNQYIGEWREVKLIGAKVVSKANEFKRNLASFEDSVNLLIDDPASLVSGISDLFDDFEAIFESPSDLYEASKQFNEFGSSYESSSFETPSRIQETINNAQLVETFRSFSVSKMALATAQDEFVSKPEVTTRRNELLSTFSERIEQAGINEQDQVRRDIIDLRSFTIGVLDDAGASLPDIDKVTYGATLPAYWIANELYGDSLRYEEIVNDNNIKHPLFVPMGQELEVLTS